MVNNFGKKDFFIVALMLFAMFFGAGNFILPPMVGKEAGENFYLAIMFFCATGVALPVLGVAAVARAGTLRDLASRVHPIFAAIFVAAIYISIGPLLAIPRASTMPYEIMILPYLNPAESSFSIPLLIYTFIYFAINYYICLNPTTILDALGKYLTPILLALIAIFFISALIFADVNIAKASGEYINHPVSKAFVEGYQTMDALAALVFGISVVGALKAYGIKNKERLANITIKAGLFSGSILMIIYMMLGYLGYIYGNTFVDITNGAGLLSSISNDLYGNFGRFILGIIAFLACLTTTIGLIGSSASYFSSISKVKYKTWVILWTISSFAIANQGLTQILKFSVPVLIALYPIAIVLIILSLINKIIESSKIIYRSSIYTAGFIGILNAIDLSGLNIGDGLRNALNALPFYSSMLGWVVPVVVMFLISCVIHFFNKKDSF